jgi:hypothetical protein
MKRLTVIIAAILLAPAVVTAEPNTKLTGDREALLACKAVLSDDPVKLDSMLANYHRKNNTLSYYLPKHDPAILKDFSCNDMSLYEFSNKIGANNVSRYIRGYMQGEPRVYVEDVANSSEAENDTLYY